MDSSATIVGLELLVPDLDDALAFFVEQVGFAVAHRGPSPEVAGEIAVLDAGPVALTLIQPLDGPAAPIPDQSPRLTQLMISADEPSLLAERVLDAGLPVETVDATTMFVPPLAMQGVLGFRAAVVVTAPVDDGR